LIDLDADRNDRGLHFRDQVGKTGRTLLRLGGLRGAHERLAMVVEAERAAEREGCADDGDGAEQRQAPRRQQFWLWTMYIVQVCHEEWSPRLFRSPLRGHLADQHEGVLSRVLTLRHAARDQRRYRRRLVRCSAH